MVMLCAAGLLESAGDRHRNAADVERYLDIAGVRARTNGGYIRAPTGPGLGVTPYLSWFQRA
jgi:hypothetical protein